MNCQLAAELAAMADADQAAVRATIGSDGRLLPAGHPSFGAEHQLRVSHLARLRQILNEHGWPTISMVGTDAAQCAAQHTDHDAGGRPGRFTVVMASAAVHAPR